MKSTGNVFAAACLSLAYCVAAQSADTTITVENPLAGARQQETVEVPWTGAAVMVKENGKLIPSQISEGKLLFQSNFAAHEKKTFTTEPHQSNNNPNGDGPVFQHKTYGRHAPERMDDYAWENDRIAFRVYGPALMEKPPKGEGLVSSSVDVWVKRTRNLVLDKWYKSKAYHIDHGEGLDNYKCGSSRGCGGIGVWADGKLHVSQNWATWKTICSGPIRTVAEFTYAPWECGNGVKIRELRRITLDAGSNLNRFESVFTIEGADSATIAVGLDVSKEHKHTGTLTGDADKGWLVNWEAEQKPHGIIGTAILLPTEKVGAAKDASHVFLTAPATSAKPFTWYAGAGWSKSGDFADASSWQAYIENAMLRLRHPLKVTVGKSAATTTPAQDVNVGNEMVSIATTAFNVPPKDSPEMKWWRDSMKTRDARLAWWREARFGMFVHWGVAAQLGNKFHGKTGPYYSEHIQRALRIPNQTYLKEVTGTFNPDKFDADAWVRTAKETGMGYIVIQAKHHDGVAMWPSKVSRNNLMDASPWKHDPLKDLREACLKYGIKFCLYYSQAFDWGEENGVGNDWDFPDHPGGDLHRNGGDNWWETRADYLPTARSYVDGKAIPQLLELIHDYKPDLIWFDTPAKLPPSENLRILKAVREAGPNIVINSRIVDGLGDYESTCDRPSEFAPMAGDWEAIPTTNESYGWNPLDNTHKPASFFIRLLAKSVARGGNELMNIGPMGNGAMDPKDLLIFDGIAKWWKVNGESIRGCGTTPLAPQIWGESTRKNNTIYLHIFHWPKNGRLVVGGLRTPVVGARLLAGGALKVDRLNPLDIAIQLPAKMPDVDNTVVAVECSGEPVADSARLLAPGEGVDTLRAFDVILRGDGLHYGAGKATSVYVGGLSKTCQAIVWPVRVNEEATFDVSLICDGTKAPRTLSLRAGNQTLSATPKLISEFEKDPPGQVWWALKNWENQTLRLGRLVLKPGMHELHLSPASDFGADAMRVRALILTPVASSSIPPP